VDARALREKDTVHCYNQRSEANEYMGLDKWPRYAHTLSLWVIPVQMDEVRYCIRAIEVIILFSRRINTMSVSRGRVEPPRRSGEQRGVRVTYFVLT